MAETEHAPPETPKVTARSTVYLSSGVLRVLESFEELQEILDEAGPMDWINLTVEVNQPEIETAQIHPLFQAIGVAMRDGFTSARYRAGVVMGYVKHLPPPADGD